MRLTPLRPEDFDPEQAALFDDLVAKAMGKGELPLDERGRARGPVAVKLHHPATGRSLQELAAVLRFSGTLPDAAREVVVLAVAGRWACEHELAAHEPLARAAGIADAAITAIEAGESATVDDPVVQAALGMTQAILAREDLTDAEDAAFAAVLTEAQRVEVTVLIGYYTMAAMQMRVFRVTGRTRG